MSLFSVTANGVITVDTSDVLLAFQDAYRAALGNELNLDASTPIGQLVVNDTKMLTTAMAECVAMANETNVFYATERALDVAAAFYGYYRKTATPTTVFATLRGNAGTTIPAGAIASDGTNQYTLLNLITIPETGVVMVEFQCTTPGAIECAAGALNTIVTPVSGWDTITNANDGIIGVSAESDNAFRDRITANWLNKRARSILGAIVDNMAALNNVVSVVGRENPTNTTVTIDGVEMPAHSIFIGVLGGDEDEIASVMAAQKTLGAQTVGNTSVSWTDPVVDYNYIYNINRPTGIPIYVRIQYSANAYTPADVETRIASLVREYVAQNPIKIGQTISGNMMSMALSDFNMANILSVKVSTDNATWNDYIATTIEQVGVLSANNITVTRV